MSLKVNIPSAVEYGVILHTKFVLSSCSTIGNLDSMDQNLCRHSPENLTIRTKRVPAPSVDKVIHYESAAKYFIIFIYLFR